MDWSNQNSSASGFGGRVWCNGADEVYGQMTGRYPSFMDLRQKVVAERVRQSRLLYRSRHRSFFMFEGRTQQPFKEMDVNGRREKPYFAFNLLRLISRKTADLLFGEEAEIKAVDDIQQSKLQDLVERTSFSEILKDAAILASWGGQVFVEVCIYRGEVYIQTVPGDEMFPVGILGPDRQYQSYKRLLRRNVGTLEKPNFILLETFYEAGLNRRLLWQLDEFGMEKGKQLDIGQWTVLTGEDAPAAEERTGVAWPTVVWIPNELEEGEAASDYDGLVGLQDLVNHKATQIALILQQHSDPWMYFPRGLADEEGNIKSEFKAFFTDDPKSLGYLTWDAQLDYAMKDKSSAVSALLVAAEMSPVLLGLDEGQAPEAFKTLQLRANNAIAMAARKAKTWKAGIGWVLETAQALEHAIPGNRYDRGSIGVTLRDGIPVDELEQAQSLSLLKSAALLSQKRGVSLLVPDDAAQTAELADLAEDAKKAAASAVPSVMMGNMTGTGETLPGDNAPSGQATTNATTGGGGNS